MLPTPVLTRMKKNGEECVVFAEAFRLVHEHYSRKLKTMNSYRPERPSSELVTDAIIASGFFYWIGVGPWPRCVKAGGVVSSMLYGQTLWMTEKMKNYGDAYTEWDKLAKDKTMPDKLKKEMGSMLFKQYGGLPTGYVIAALRN